MDMMMRGCSRSPRTEAKEAGTSELAEDECAVRSAEAERILDGDIDAHFTRSVCAVVEIAGRILIENIDRRRRDLFMDSEDGEYRLKASSATKQVSCHGLGRVDHHALGMVTKRPLDRHGFSNITERR